jgi:hypothetical protein
MVYIHLTVNGITHLRFARTEKDAKELCAAFENTFWHEPKVVERKVA